MGAIDLRMDLLGNPHFQSSCVLWTGVLFVSSRTELRAPFGREGYRDYAHNLADGMEALLAWFSFGVVADQSWLIGMHAAFHLCYCLLGHIWEKPHALEDPLYRIYAVGVYVVAIAHAHLSASSLLAGEEAEALDRLMVSNWSMLTGPLNWWLFGLTGHMVFAVHWLFMQGKCWLALPAYLDQLSKVKLATRAASASPLVELSLYTAGLAGWVVVLAF